MLDTKSKTLTGSALGILLWSSMIEFHQLQSTASSQPDAGGHCTVRATPASTVNTTIANTSMSRSN